MSIEKAKEEFISRVTSSTKVKAAEITTVSSEITTVSSLIKWFMTSDYKQLKPYSIDTNWAVTGTVPGKNNTKGMKLICGYMADNSKLRSPAIAVRVPGSDKVLFNSELTEVTAAKVIWTMLMAYSDKYIGVNFIDSNLHNAAIRHIDTEAEGIYRYTINNVKYLFIPDTSIDSGNKKIITPGILIKSTLDPKAANALRGRCIRCFGPYYLKPSINPLLASAKNEMQTAYVTHVSKVIDLTSKAVKVKFAASTDADKQAYIQAFSNLIADNDIDVWECARLIQKQMEQYIEPFNLVSFMGLKPPTISTVINNSTYILTATAMASNGGKLYVTGTINVEKQLEYKFDTFDSNMQWLEVTTLPGITKMECGK